MTATAHAERAHASLGASGAYRWMACPGSIALTAHLSNPTSEYAAEGTAAHEVLELCLRDKHDAVEMIGRRFGKCDAFPDGFEVDEDMAEAVQVAIDWVRQVLEPGDVLFLERRFDLTPLAHTRPALAAADVAMFGTCDILIWKPELGWVYVADYKHGKGVPVEATGNPQLRYYALGALEALAADGVHPSRAVLHIIQPRAPHRAGPVRSEGMDVLDLIDWSDRLMSAAVETTQPDPRLAAGDHCKFCPAAHACPELDRESRAIAVAEFGAPIPDGDAFVPPDPSTLPPDRLAAILIRADLVETWIKAVRAHAFRVLDGGGVVPGFKLVQGEGCRKWADDVEAAIVLSELGVPDDDYAPRKIVTPAQAEKVLGGVLKTQGIKGFAKEAKSKLAGLCIKPPSGAVLARDEDPRPALAGASGAAAEFDALTDP